MTEKETYKLLIQRYRENKATDEELEVFFQLARDGKLDEIIGEVIDESYEFSINKIKVIPLVKRTWFRVAAAVFILLVSGTLFLLNKKAGQQQIVQAPPPSKGIAPGGNKALLVLSNGETIILDSAQNGTLSHQGNTKILKLSDGQLAYNTSGQTNEVLYNTISTPRGGQYQMTLSDGSKVWLNSASSIKFPVAFVGNERKVDITGEVYFEVAKYATMPFKVNVADKQEVEVLGTHFNINAYADEATINTTLLEGKVKVTATNLRLTTNNSRLLSPGQQVRQTGDGNILLNSNLDMDEVMAWKNGKFVFQGLDIQSVMRQVSKWYDVEVEYRGTITKEEFVGVISRNVNVSEIIKMLEETDAVHFEIEGKKIIVK